MSERSLLERIESACITACTCLTKTPDWEAHEVLCRYRLLREASEAICEHNYSFDLRWNADMRAIKRWQAATGRELTWPDHADLVVWLLEQLDAAEDALQSLVDAYIDTNGAPTNDNHIVNQARAVLAARPVAKP